MKTFKRKTFYTAVLAALGAMGAVGTASAVNVNPDGLGQALIYPYYTVRNAGGQYNTYLSVVNTTSSTKAIKVRFLEGKNSREVLDFNVYLSPFDVWTAAVVPNSTDASTGGKMITSDKSCMVPQATSLPFVNYAYTGANADREAAGLDRTNEGYFEILEMAELIGTITTGLKHVAGVPANCGVLGANEVNVTSANTVLGSGGLSGSATVINSATGAAFGYDPVALDAWNQTGQIFSVSGSILPDLSFVAPKISKLFDGNRTVQTDWSGFTLAQGFNPIDPVSAVLMHDNVINEFILDSGTKSGTDWVVTFPTKRNYVGLDPINATGSRLNTAATKLFQSNFGLGGSCDNISNAQHDREEASVNVVSIPSPPPPGPQTDQLCWEANVMSFATATAPSNILGSTNVRNVTSGYQNGWMNLNFPLVTVANLLYPLAHQLVAPQFRADGVTPATQYTINSTVFNVVGAGAIYYGLPVVGFAVQDYINTGVVSMYGGRFNHKFSRLITP